MLTFTSTAQNEVKNRDSHKSESHFRVSMAVAHTLLPERTTKGTQNLVLPTFAFDIEYWLNHKWGIGLHNDLELLNFEVVESHDEVTIEREFPVLITLDVLWKPIKNFVVFTSPGIELEPNTNYFVFRMGCEYEFPFSEKWDLAPLVFYDMRDGAYNTITFGLGVGYNFKKSKQHH